MMSEFGSVGRDEWIVPLSSSSCKAVFWRRQEPNSPKDSENSGREKRKFPSELLLLLICLEKWKGDERGDTISTVSGGGSSRKQAIVAVSHVFHVLQFEYELEFEP